MALALWADPATNGGGGLVFSKPGACHTHERLFMRTSHILGKTRKEAANINVKCIPKESLYTFHSYMPNGNLKKYGYSDWKWISIQ